jgi:hypothetical protein
VRFGGPLISSMTRTSGGLNAWTQGLHRGAFHLLILWMSYGMG